MSTGETTIRDRGALNCRGQLCAFGAFEFGTRRARVAFLGCESQRLSSAQRRRGLAPTLSVRSKTTADKRHLLHGGQQALFAVPDRRVVVRSVLDLLAETGQNRSSGRSIAVSVRPQMTTTEAIRVG